jgi:multiple sugar transport system permease protein
MVLGRRLLGKGFNLLIILIIIISCLFPLVYLFITSIKPAELFFAKPPKFIFNPDFTNYFKLFQEGYSKFYANSFIISTISTITALVIGAMTAFGFCRYRFKGNGLLFFTILATRMYMPVTTLIPVYLAMRFLGLQDTRISLILIYISFQLPLVIYILRGFFEEIPKSLQESAELDGCNPISLFWRIILPMSGPGLLASGILIFIFNWNEFLFALILTSFKATTAPVAIMAFIESEGTLQWGEVAVLGFAMVLPILFFTIFMNKFLIKGLISGSVKG